MRLYENPATTSKVPALSRPAFGRIAAAAHPGDALTVSELFRLCRCGATTPPQRGLTGED